MPPPIQAVLTAKLAAYDRNLQQRAGDRVNVLLLAKPDDVQSERAVIQMEQGLQSYGTMASLPVKIFVEQFSGPRQVVEACRAQRVGVLYVGPGLGDQVASVADALRGGDVLSVGASAAYVPRGIVVGFDLVSGKPKLLINLSQARQQNVAFRSEVLKLARIIG